MKHDFRYVSKNSSVVKREYKNVVMLLNELQKELKDKFKFQYQIVGSYKRNMITYDTKSNIGYDFDFNLEPNEDRYSAKEVKLAFINGLNKIVKKYGYDYPENSTRVITIKKKDTKHSKIICAVDFAIVNNYIYGDDEGQEYIRFNKKQNSYSWDDQSNGYYRLPEKIEWVKENDLWNELRDLYIELKNSNEDTNIHSRTIFANAIHQICQQNGFYNKDE